MNWETVTQGAICLQDDTGLEYLVCKLDYDLGEDENYRYVFTPNYSVISLLTPKVFQGIPGLALEKHKETYIRENMTPVFLSERTPGEHREDLWELLQSVGMTSLNRLEWLIRTNMRYSGDDFYVRRFTQQDQRQCQLVPDFSPRDTVIASLRKSLEPICLGHHVIFPWGEVTDENRDHVHGMLLALLRQALRHNKEARFSGTRAGAQAGHYRGRRPIELSPRKVSRVFRDFSQHRLTEAEALAELQISRATFFRRLKKWSLDKDSHA